MATAQAATVAAAKAGPNKETPPLHETELYVKVEPWQWPIIYSPEYNISFAGFEKLHPFDAGKWGRIYEFLKEEGLIQDHTTVRPVEASKEDLLVVHTKQYLDTLKWSKNVAMITEIPPVALIPNFIVQRKVLRPFRYHVGGTILAAKLAMERGWAINIGGGFHHCSSKQGGGFCAYADITLAIKFLFQRDENVKKAMIIDLDAHQGNGHERDFMDDENVFILDAYNRGIYPHDGFAKRGIQEKIELNFYIDDDTFFAAIKDKISNALDDFKPNFVLYNAGTDCLDGDPLGSMAISATGIIQRDEFVFQECRTRDIPIVMVTSGGYQKSNAGIISDSILNLHEKGLISCEEAKNAPPPVQKVEVSSVTMTETLTRSISEPRGLWCRFKSTCFGTAATPTPDDVPDTSPNVGDVNQTVPRTNSVSNISEIVEPGGLRRSNTLC